MARDWREHDEELARLKREQEHLEQSLYRQALRLEEHDDPAHPVVVVAKQRIEELTSRRASIDDAIRTIEACRPNGAHPDEIVAMLDAVPDLRPKLRNGTPEEMADIFEAFDVSATYDKRGGKLRLAATVTAELVAENEKPRAPGEASGNSYIAGAGFEPATFGL